MTEVKTVRKNSGDYKTAKEAKNWKRYSLDNDFVADSVQPRGFDWDMGRLTRNVVKNTLNLHVHSNLHYELRLGE